MSQFQRLLQDCGVNPQLYNEMIDLMEVNTLPASEFIPLAKDESTRRTIIICIIECRYKFNYLSFNNES